MKKLLISDVSFVLLFPKDPAYTGSLNGLYKEHKDDPGFSFFDYFILNKDLLKIYAKYFSKEQSYIFTSDSIQNDLALQPHLKEIFSDLYSAKKMGVHKSEVSSYLKLVEKIGADVSEIVYIDDSEKNIESARKAGLDAYQYISNEQIQDVLKDL